MAGRPCTPLWETAFRTQTCWTLSVGYSFSFFYFPDTWHEYMLFSNIHDLDEYSLELCDTALPNCARWFYVNSAANATSYPRRNLRAANTARTTGVGKYGRESEVPLGTRKES